MPQSGVLHITADNGYEVWLNGEYVGGAQVMGDWQNSNRTEPFVHSQGWQSVENYDVSAKLQKGANTLIVTAANEYRGALDNEETGTAESNPAGVIFELKATSNIACSNDDDGDDGPVCSEYAISFTSVPQHVAPGSSFTVSGTLNPSEGTEDLSGKTVMVDGVAVSVSGNSWTTQLTAPETTGDHLVTASYVNPCEATFSKSTTVDVKTPSPARGATMGGYCGDGWHKENGQCVENPKPKPAPEEHHETQSSGLDVTKETPIVEDKKAPDPTVPLDLAAHNDDGSLLTGNVAGAGMGASWIWLLILAGVIVAGLGIYAYRRHK